MDRGPGAGRIVPTKAFHIGRHAVRYRRRTDGWEIWLMGNADCTVGTYLMFYDGGGMEKVTLHEDGGVSTFVVEQ